MSEEKMTASLSIDAKYVEEEVSRIVKAAIVSALGNRDEIIRKAIDRTIDTYVDRDGNLAERTITEQDRISIISQKRR